MPYDMLNFKWCLMVLGQYMTILAGIWSVKIGTAWYYVVQDQQRACMGPPLFGLHPNGLFTFWLSLIGLQGYLDYCHLDYL